MGEKNHALSDKKKFELFFFFSNSHDVRKNILNETKTHNTHTPTHPAS